MKRRKLSHDSDDEFDGDDGVAEEVGMYELRLTPLLIEPDEDDFIVPDDSEDDIVVRTTKRKRPTPTKRQESPEVYEDVGDVDMSDLPASTAQQWKYDPDMVRDIAPLPKKSKPKATFLKSKPRPHETDPETRHNWLANPIDLDRNPVGHPDYDPRTIYVPPLAFSKLSNFEKQYWEIKSKLWDTVVFFKKGKFYELYEQDATIGNQEFDLKLTDRVNMRMVGVPESSIDHWANQFVAKGYKIAKVDQMESQLGKEIRERDEQATKATKDKVIRRELTSVLTAATLVEGSMLQDDMATYCMAIKEEVGDDGVPSFGFAFVDTATAQFELSEFVDDIDMTKFETLIAQIRPRELLLEKGHISAKALRILKNNTGPSTIWTYLKPAKEFWTAEITEFELRGGAYFVDEEGIEKIPSVIADSKGKELAISSYGAVVQYLQNLKIDKQIVTLGNVSWYDPIRKATSLVLDGQSLINLEIFANTVDGGPQGTLFNTLNRCVTPFGKRMLKQWVCHPLADSARINARLDAVESLLAQQSIMSQFSDSLSRMPDLERLISRIHAQSIKVPDFIRVLEGFEQIDYTMAMLREIPAGDGVIGQLITAAPDLKPKLDEWKEAFNKDRAISEHILVPAPGVEKEYDESQATVDACLQDLDEFLREAKKQFGGSKSICYRDNGKEIYQLEMPVNMKGVPKEWDQMSATKAVKRYYTPKLRKLVRALQEAKEIHSQIVKDVINRFCVKFDEDYEMWLLAVKIVAQLDCLISLARASANLGEPACRPVFTDEDRTVVEFEDLRHPCMINTVTDFIPNDINLGGTTANINLLTGANAAGKSTVLRMVSLNRLASSYNTNSFLDLCCCNHGAGGMLRARPIGPLVTH
jgi:DNA mismatch repair protein MSH6